VSGITLDAGGLIALDRGDRRVLALLARAAERGMRVTVPATALAQVIRRPARQARLARLIRQASIDLVPLDGPDARPPVSCWPPAAPPTSSAVMSSSERVGPSRS